MLLLRFMVLILIFYVIRIVKTDEISTSTLQNVMAKENSTIVSKGSSTENNINTSTLDTLITSSSTSAFNSNEAATTSSWELIYPDRNSTQEESFTTFANTTPTNTALFPKYFKVDDVTNCQKYFGECLRQVLSTVIPKLKNGHSNLNIPSIDPIYFNATAFQFNNGPFTGHITIRYAHIYGLTTMKLKKLDFYKMENKKFKARLMANVPKMRMIGSYKGDLKINNVAVRPRGDFNITMLGLQMDLLCLGSIYQGAEQHTFLKFNKNNVTAAFRDSKINATGIFPDQRLNEIVVNVANQYWRELFNAVLPETRSYWSPIVLSALNGALAMVPFDFLF